MELFIYNMYITFIDLTREIIQIKTKMSKANRLLELNLDFELLFLTFQKNVIHLLSFNIYLIF